MCPNGKQNPNCPHCKGRGVVQQPIGDASWRQVACSCLNEPLPVVALVAPVPTPPASEPVPPPATPHADAELCEVTRVVLTSGRILTVHLRRHAGNRAIVVRSEQNGKGSSVVVPLGAIAPLLRAALHRIDGAGRLTPTPDDEDADADADGGAA